MSFARLTLRPCSSSKLPSSYFILLWLPPLLVWCSVIIILHFQDKHTFYIHHWVHNLQCLLILQLHHQQMVISVQQTCCMYIEQDFFFFQHRRSRQCKYNIPVLKWLKKQKNRTKNEIKYLRLWFGSAENSQLYQIGWMKKTGFALNGWNELFFQLIKVIEKCIGNYIGFFFSQGMVMGKLRRIQF